jgi:hypothetical protein
MFKVNYLFFQYNLLLAPLPVSTAKSFTISSKEDVRQFLINKKVITSISPSYKHLMSMRRFKVYNQAVPAESIYLLMLKGLRELNEDQWKNR